MKSAIQQKEQTKLQNTSCKQAVKLTIKMLFLNIDLKFFKLSSEANFANLH